MDSGLLIFYLLFVGASRCLYVQGSLDARYHTVLVYGEPKSGTSWLSVIVDRALQVLCEDYTRSRQHHRKSKEKNGCLMLPPRGDSRIALTYMIGRRKTKFTSASKHHVPDVKNTPSCMHENWHPTTSSPCGLVNDNSTITTTSGGPAPAVVPQPSDLTTCLRTCYEPPSLTKRATYTYIHVIRDPRDSSVSACYYNNEVNRSYNGSLASCLLATFPKVLLWTKFREMVFAKPATRTMGPLLCYEELASRSPRVVENAYSIVISALGGKRGGGLESNHKLTSRIVETTSESALRRTNSSSSGGTSTRSGHRRSSNIVIDALEAKLRATGGANRHYTSYDDKIGGNGEVVAQRLLHWMNESFSLFERHHPSPCRTHREAMGLY